MSDKTSKRSDSFGSLNSLDDSWTAPQSHGIENITERLSQHQKHAGIHGGGGQKYKLAQHISA